MTGNACGPLSWRVLCSDPDVRYLSRFEQRNLAPESRLARREHFYAALGTGTMRSGTVDLHLPQADSSSMSDLMRVEEALRLRCRMHIHPCGIEVYLVA